MVFDLYSINCNFESVLILAQFSQYKLLYLLSLLAATLDPSVSLIS